MTKTSEDLCRKAKFIIHSFSRPWSLGEKTLLEACETAFKKSELDPNLKLFEKGREDNIDFREILRVKNMNNA